MAPADRSRISRSAPTARLNQNLPDFRNRRISPESGRFFRLINAFAWFLTLINKNFQNLAGTTLRRSAVFVAATGTRRVGTEQE